MRLAIFGVLTAAVLAGLWWWLKPAHRPAPVPPPAAAVPAPAQEAPAAPTPRRFHLRVPADTGADGVLRVRKGEAVVITVSSDRADELHLHGYDLTLDLRPGETGTLAFTAAHAGRFEIELHRGHVALAVLEVIPD
ncbi:hypothetical protein SAMN04488120_104203 [Fontimonas thermophila]|uniref:Cupredoxin-like domain-containing protein n=1 Tax=Fontimonas thermophila TaxID=1076937 RepID=A0A1I2IRA5_9GAMM|nr:hypothetical protein [Fontimonas thermophila]SFF44942.1 hypothetical protein SAMN04488120_104203 [Fontimonas thermophila]